MKELGFILFFFALWVILDPQAVGDVLGTVVNAFERARFGRGVTP